MTYYETGYSSQPQRYIMEVSKAAVAEEWTYDAVTTVATQATDASGNVARLPNLGVSDDEKQPFNAFVTVQHVKYDYRGEDSSGLITMTAGIVDWRDVLYPAFIRTMGAAGLAVSSSLLAIMIVN